MASSNNSQKTFDLAQFELYSDKTIREFLNKITVPHNATIYDLGAGKGLLTKALSITFDKICAVEIDKDQFTQLKANCEQKENIILVNQDILKLEIKDPKYHIISNPPFNITKKLLNRILFQYHLPESWHFILQDEVCDKITKQDGGHNSLSAFLNTFYHLQKIHSFKRTDFQPKAHVSISAVSAVLKKGCSRLTTPEQRKNFSIFIESIFQNSNKDLKTRLKKYFTNIQISKLAKDHKINLTHAPYTLTSDQWVALFLFHQK